MAHHVDDATLETEETTPLPGTQPVFLAVGSDSVPTAPPEDRSTAPRGSWSIVAFFGIALAIAVGLETIFSGWSAVMPAEALHLDASVAALGTTAFWTFMSVGRLIGWLCLVRGVRAAPLGIALSSIAVTALLVAAFLRTSAPGAALASAAIAVVAIGPLYSLIIGSALDRTQQSEAARIIGLLVAAGAIGGAVVPLAALTTTGAASAPSTFIFSAIGFAMLGILFALMLRSPAEIPDRSSDQRV